MPFRESMHKADTKTQMTKDATERIVATGTFALARHSPALQHQNASCTPVHPTHVGAMKVAACPACGNASMLVKCTASSLAWITLGRSRQRPYGPSVACAPLNRLSTSTTIGRAARQIHPRVPTGTYPLFHILEHGRFALIHNCVHLQSGGAHQQVPCVGTRAITPRHAHGLPGATPAHLVAHKSR